MRRHSTSGTSAAATSSATALPPSSSATRSICVRRRSTCCRTPSAPASAAAPPTGAGVARAADYPPGVPQDDLTGQVALVTGGGRGIGAGIARELADAGARVAVAARTNEQVEEVAREIGGLAIELDVTDQAAVERAVADTERELGPIDLLCANAGIGGPDGRPWEVDPADWWRVLEVNVLGVFLCIRAVV